MKQEIVVIYFLREQWVFRLLRLLQETVGNFGEIISSDSDSVYDSVAYDPVKTKLSESETEAEETTNRKYRN